MLVSVSMFPTDGRRASVSAEVAKVIDLIDRSGLPYRVTAMSTLIEGEWSDIMELLDRCRRRLRRSHRRVYMVMTVDDRAGARGRLTGKITSVEKRLGREVRK